MGRTRKSFPLQQASKHLVLRLESIRQRLVAPRRILREQLVHHRPAHFFARHEGAALAELHPAIHPDAVHHLDHAIRSEEHTSELQSLMRITYAVFCLKKKKTITTIKHKYY